MTRRMMFWIFALPFGVATFSSCSTDHKPTGSTNPAQVAKIKVNQEGVIALNDQTVTLEQVKAFLSKLSESSSAAVWYYRENAEGEPHPNAMLVLQAIVDAKLPVKLSTKPDFSDSVGPAEPPR